MVRPSPKARVELHKIAAALAQQYCIIKHHSQLFVPVNWFLPVVDSVQPEPKDTIWLPMSLDEILEFGNTRGNILFQNTGEFNSFGFMLKQEAARPAKIHVDEILIKTEDGLRVLNSDGELVPTNGDFIPNVLWPKLNPDPELKQRVMDELTNWLGDPAPVTSLLHHLATMLAPGWSASKLVLFLGTGRNGKSTLLKMVEKLVGAPNVSHVTRQQMATREPAIVDLNNKLANIVYDGSMGYLRDSSTEKTLVVGEPFGVRMLYESTNTIVQTNALFLEGLNEEPKSRDKTTALQRRIVRFYFPREFPLNKEFENFMLSEPVLGAFLSLLLDHYVHEDEQAAKLVPSQMSYDLQIDQLWANSKTFQHLHEMVSKDHGAVSRIVGGTEESVALSLQAHLLNGKDEYSTVDVLRMMKECYVVERRSIRIGSKIGKERYIARLTPEAQRMVDKIIEEGDPDGGVLEDAALVDDGPVPD